MAARELGHELTPHTAGTARWPVWFFFGLVGASIVGLVAAPWPLAEKLYTIVHGLCAQRPSHSFAFGGARLPFDARMTIYGGTLLTAPSCWRAARPARSARPAARSSPRWSSSSRVMGADGLNSTFKDFGAVYLYEPDNRLRLATGLLMGTTVGVVLGYLLNVTLWSRASETRAAGGLARTRRPAAARRRLLPAHPLRLGRPLPAGRAGLVAPTREGSGGRGRRGDGAGPDLPGPALRAREPLRPPGRSRRLRLRRGTSSSATPCWR